MLAARTSMKSCVEVYANNLLYKCYLYAVCLLRSNVLDVARGAMYAYVLEVSDGPERVINNSDFSVIVLSLD